MSTHVRWTYQSNRKTFALLTFPGSGWHKVSLYVPVVPQMTPSHREAGLVDQ
uniref:Uncharacterized protein n=1 Tax=Rhizophora mucronata TaxID=61149 RepID=A0A2P2LJE4_RHIMU